MLLFGVGSIRQSCLGFLDFARIRDQADENLFPLFDQRSDQGTATDSSSIKVTGFSVIILPNAYCVKY